MRAAARATVAATALLLLVGGLPGGVDEAAAKTAKPLVLSPKPGARLPARPLTVRVRAGDGAKLFRARLNGRPIGRHFQPPRRGVRKLRASPSHGVRHGRNVLRVKVRRASGTTVERTTRFRVRRDGPLAAAGRNRLVNVDGGVRLNGSRSRSHLRRGGADASAAAPSGARLHYRWKVVDAPESTQPREVLDRRRSARPVLSSETPGAYRIRLTVEAADGEAGSDVVVIKPGSGVAPHIDAVATALRERNPGTEGKIWGISTGNALPDKWLLQTPNCWGMTDCGAGPLPPSAGTITSRMTEIVSRAKKSVDLSGLWPPPDGVIRDAIVDGLKQAVKAGNKPTVRVILGTPPAQFSDSDFKRWFNDLVTAVGGNLPIQAAGVSTYRYSFASPFTSWNHSKVLAVDGQSVIVGGMNYWAGDYMQVTNPVNDISITADGPAAVDAVRFEDVLWGWTCDNRSRSSYVSMRKSNVDGCVSEAKTLPAGLDGHGDVPILTLGRLGNGIEVPGEAGRKSPEIPPAPVQGSACTAVQRQVSDTNTDREYEYRNPGETGLRALIGSATSSIFISQQDLLSCKVNVEAYFDERVMAAIGQKIIDGVKITIVISNKASGDYSNGYTLANLATVLKQEVAAQKKVSAADARQLVCDKVGLAGVRTLDSPTWPSGHAYANHAKLVSVDGAAFYVGSENLYPARLQELGMVVEDPDAAKTLQAEYLGPLWDRSRKGALIDPDKPCDASF